MPCLAARRAIGDRAFPGIREDAAILAGRAGVPPAGSPGALEARTELPVDSLEGCPSVPSAARLVVARLATSPRGLRTAPVRRSEDQDVGRVADDLRVAENLPLDFEEAPAQPARSIDLGSRGQSRLH